MDVARARLLGILCFRRYVPCVGWCVQYCAGKRFTEGSEPLAEIACRVLTEHANANGHLLNQLTLEYVLECGCIR